MAWGLGDKRQRIRILICALVLFGTYAAMARFIVTGGSFETSFSGVGHDVMLRAADLDNSGTVDASEYAAVFAGDSNPNVQRAFTVLDVDGDGVLSPAEQTDMTAVVETMDIVTDGDIQEGFWILDGDGDGVVDGYDLTAMGYPDWERDWILSYDSDASGGLDESEWTAAQQAQRGSTVSAVKQKAKTPTAPSTAPPTGGPPVNATP